MAKPIKKADKVTSKDNSQHSGSDSDNSGNTKNLNDQFEDLFAESPEGIPFRVELRRIEPQEYDGNDITGYLEDMPGEIGNLSVQAYVKKKYGGGLYHAIKRSIGENRGQFMDHLRWRISGLPRIPDIEEVQTGPLNLLPSTDYHGMEIGGTHSQFEARMERMLMLKKILDEPKPMDINSVLLTSLLESRSSGGINSQLDQLTTLAGFLKEIKGDESGAPGKTAYDLLDSALTQFGKMIDKGGQGANRSIVGQKSVLLPRKTGASDNNLQANNNQPENIEGDQVADMSKNELASYAVSILVSLFMLPQRKSVSESVSALNLGLDLTDQVKQGLASYKSAISDLGLAQLSQLGAFEEKPELQGEWEKYFSNVFDSFVAPKVEGA